MRESVGPRTQETQLRARDSGLSQEAGGRFGPEGQRGLCIMARIVLRFGAIAPHIHRKPAKSWVDPICAQRSNAARDASNATAQPAFNAFTFRLIRANSRRVVEVGLILVAGMALILQYGHTKLYRYRTLRVASFSIGRSRALRNSQDNKTRPRRGRRDQARHRNAQDGWHASCGFFFAVAERLHTSKGKGKT